MLYVIRFTNTASACDQGDQWEQEFSLIGQTHKAHVTTDWADVMQQLRHAEVLLVSLRATTSIGLQGNLASQAVNTGQKRKSKVGQGADALGE